MVEIIPCAYCGGAATHFCDRCKHWICDRFLCKAKASAVVLGVISEPPRRA
jgi:hypothetical protein